MNMDSKSSNRQKRKITSEQKVRRALAQLDSAVQAWYAEHNPKDKEHYADATFIDYPEEGTHISRIALQTDLKGKAFTDIYSSKHYIGDKV